MEERYVCLVVDCLFWLRQGRHRGLKGVKSKSGHRIELLAYLLGTVGNAMRELRADGVVLCLADVDPMWSDNISDSNLQERLCYDNFKDLGMAYRESDEWAAGALCAMVARSVCADDVIVISERKSLHPILEQENIALCDSRMNLTYDSGVPYEGARWIEYAALCGIVPDIAEGIPGVGPKTAGAIVDSCYGEDLCDVVACVKAGRIPERMTEKQAGLLISHGDAICEHVTSLQNSVYDESLAGHIGTITTEETSLSGLSALKVNKALKDCGLNTGHAAGLLGAVSLSSIR